MSLISKIAKKHLESSPLPKSAVGSGVFDLGDVTNPDRWGEGYHDGVSAAQGNDVEQFSAYQPKVRWDSYSAGFIAAWLDYQDMGHDRMRQFSGSKRQANREGWVVEIINYYDDPGGVSTKFWYQDRDGAEKYADDYIASEDSAIMRETEVKVYPGTEDGQQTGGTVLGNRKTSSKPKHNPVGSRVTVKDGPDAGLTGLVSRQGQGGWYVEIEGVETGPYKVSSLAVPKTAKRQKFAFNEGDRVMIDIGGEEVPGIVSEDDGGETVMVSSDDPFEAAGETPAEVQRGDVRLASNKPDPASRTASKKVAFTVADLYNLVQRPDHLGFGYAAQPGDLPTSVKVEVDEAVAKVATEMGLSEDEFFMWLNAKPARWLWDSMTFPDKWDDIEGEVRKELNDFKIRELKVEGSKTANADQSELVSRLRTLMQDAEYGDASPEDISEFGDVLQEIGDIMGRGEWSSNVNTTPWFNDAVALWDRVGDRKIVWT